MFNVFLVDRSGIVKNKMSALEMKGELLLMNTFDENFF